jgi:hypothetical protein
LLEETLNEEKETDQKLTELAESMLNAQAAQGAGDQDEEEEEEKKPARAKTMAAGAGGGRTAANKGSGRAK